MCGLGVVPEQTSMDPVQGQDVFAEWCLCVVDHLKYPKLHEWGGETLARLERDGTNIGRSSPFSNGCP